MPRLLNSLFALYTLTPGRRIYALGAVRERALARDLEKIMAAIDVAIAQDRDTLEVDAARLAGTSSPPVRERDAVVDRTLVMIERLLSFFAQGDKPAVPAALHANLFPVNLVHHIRLPFIEQAAANERVLKVLESETHKKWLNNHGLRPLVVQLRNAHETFAAALHARDSESVPSWEKVKSARELGQELYLQVVARVIVEFLDDPESRDQLLEPIYAQNEKIKAYRRQRRSTVDVDPDSGEPLEGGEVGEDDGEGGDEEGDEEFDEDDEFALDQDIDAQPEPALV